MGVGISFSDLMIMGCILLDDSYFCLNTLV